MSSSEQLDNVRAMTQRLAQEVQAATTNNLAHATVTTNAFRDAVEMIPKTCGALDTLLQQRQSDAQTQRADPMHPICRFFAFLFVLCSSCSHLSAPVSSCSSSSSSSPVGPSKAGQLIGQCNTVASVSQSLAGLQGIKLVFDTPARQLLVKKAITAVTNLQTLINSLQGQSGGGFSGSTRTVTTTTTTVVSHGGAPATLTHSQAYTSSTIPAGASNIDILNAPMPQIAKTTVVFNPDAMRTGSTSSGENNHNVKPVNKQTFSSAEGSVSARLGVEGKCAACGAHRKVGEPFCTSCGKAANIIFH